jgi:hypothetical protein
MDFNEAKLIKFIFHGYIDAELNIQKYLFCILDNKIYQNVIKELEIIHGPIELNQEIAILYDYNNEYSIDIQFTYSVDDEIKNNVITFAFDNNFNYMNYSTN